MEKTYNVALLRFSDPKKSAPHLPLVLVKISYNIVLLHLAQPFAAII